MAKVRVAFKAFGEDKDCTFEAKVGRDFFPAEFKRSSDSHLSRR